MAASTVIQHRRMPNEEEMEALADHCLAEAAKKLDAPHPALAPGTILGTPTAAELRIDSVSSICGVNALGEDAALDLSQGQMTVVYGPNGAGKSGYARLMKHVCGARAKGSIHGNVFKQNPDAASALIKVTATRSDGTTSSADLTWQASDGPHATLKAVPVFDSATALEFGDSATTATHLPRAMRFVKLQRLSAITPTDCALIDGMMTKYSAFEHSQSIDTPTWLPEPDELLKDVQDMLEWCKKFSKRAEAAAKPKA
ncbi:hypothetical protein DF40_015145 [Stenotrophomonas maltophilia M30]|nr:hypothetical protein DF40_015145 [Stenotrophomonas maltophilia M30]